ncbi:hypothetical protein [Streptococcus salivarius]
MDNLILKNGRKLPLPSFFLISNLGGGASDKTRELTYLEFYNNNPILFNYFYLRYPQFSVTEIKKLKDCTTFKKFLEGVREDFFSKSFYKDSVNFHKPAIDNILLLDSGISNYISMVVNTREDYENFDSINNIQFWKDKLWSYAEEYYDFAKKYEFDMVIGIDTGGKYTFKDNEKQNEELTRINKLINDNKIEINQYLAYKTLEYIKSKEYNVSLYMPLHSSTPTELLDYCNYIKSIEREKGSEFFGLALGGIASYRGIDDEWFKEDGEEVQLSAKQKNPYLVTKATKILKKEFPLRPIHVLGGGGIANILPVSVAGATSFDSQTPGRRAYDGNSKNSQYVNNPQYITNSKGFSKYLPSQITSQNKLNLSFSYISISSDQDGFSNCSCGACSNRGLGANLQNVKQNYLRKSLGDNESFYLARQILNIHSVHQHQIVCEFLRNSGNIHKILEDAPQYDNEIKKIVR